jgi:uncharacterized protein YfaS (alpha-2-macroglobulin family)
MMLTGLAAIPLIGIWLLAAAPDPSAARQEAQKAFQAGNFRDAYEGYRKLALDPKDDPKQVGNDLQQAIDALRRLNRVEEVDAFRKQVIDVHKDNWRLLEAAAKSFFEGEHYGFLIAGEFVRGNKRGGGRWINSYPRDRADGLKLLNQALPLALKDDEKREVGSYLVTFANNLIYSGGNTQAWRLQTLTDFNQLPEYEEGWYPGGAQGAPADEEGNPRFDYLQLPKKWDEAKTDGDRWRWLLNEAAEVSPMMHRNMTRRLFAEFLRQQFGVQTMAQYGWYLREEDDTRKDESGPYAVQTLGEDETIARLASGIKRFKLPEEFNFITVYKQVAKDDKSSDGEQSLQALAEIFTNRRQYPKAAEYWKESIERFGPGGDNWKVKQREQIVNNWGQFNNLHMEPAGTKATVDYVFRNGKHVDFEAHEIKIEKLLADVKAYLSSSPAQLDGNKIQIQNIGYRLVQENQTPYIGDKVASFGRDLEPREGHMDKRITIETPLEKPGAYLLTGTMKDGNVSRIIVWVADTAIIKKQLEGKAYYYVADAVTGKAVAKANVEFFGWQQKHLGGNKFTVETRNFAEFTDQNGQVIPSAKDLEANFQWIAIVRAGQRFSFLGFTHIWYGQQHDQEYNQAKVYTITDRPVYRPEQAVKFKFWVREAKYDQPDASQYAGQTFQMQITNPKGEAVKKQAFTTDKFGGFEGDFQLPKDATLGQWSLAIVDNQKVGGGGSFRVEEYKKPEYEVKVEAPAEPVMLGEKITAKVQAKYFFGAPVVDARVKYKVLRSSHHQVWYPPMPWDWMYGRGYWWFSPDYAWYPGWRHWGCIRPAVAWRPFAHNPPEVVAEQEVAIGADGTIEIPIDTAAAKALHPDEDHEYSITAEVVDQSRRTIVGTGKVLVARKPFTVTVWVDHGYYRAGDVIQSHMSARTLDQKPVQGEGELILYKITYNDKAEPKEEAVQTWKLNTNAEGYAHQQIKAAAAGQYRLAYKLTSGGLKVDAKVNLFRNAPQVGDAKPKTIEGAYLFTIRGENFVSENYRFNDLELIPDKKEYAPGDKVKLMINVDKADSTVLLFLRPANGVYLPPKVITMKGKSTVEEFDAVTRDMPNFFVEAVTVANGHVYSETRELAVPPEKRVLNVSVKPTQQEYKPGAEAGVKIRLTDLDGKPFEGSTVLTVYDRSVEYISGGSNVADIKSFFWKWRRHHYPQTEDNLSWVFGNLLKNGETGMQYLGVFGHSVADEFAIGKGMKPGMPRGGGMGGFGGGRMSKLRAANGAAATPMAAKRSNSADRQEADAAFALADDAAPGAEGGEGGGGAMVEPTVRKNFADTAYWAASLTTDKNGEADVKFTLPESLTGWKLKAWAMGQGTKVGEGEAEVVTKKNLLVRMQAPRFFVESDEVVLSANVHNYLPHDKVVKVSISFEGDELQPITPVQQSVTIKAKDEHRVDWRIKVVKEGNVAITMTALTDEESDAMQLKFPVYVHGILRQEAFAGSIRPGKESASVTLKVPEKRRINDARLVAQFSPSLAGAMVDALPYLVEYPHDSTDATLCRFLPTVVTQNILLKMKLDLKAIRDKRTNLNAQELGAAEERAKGWKRFPRNPVFDQDEVTQMVKEGVKKLTEMQLSDGGWGWFSGWGEHSWPHTTAVVVHGLQVAKTNDVAIVPGTLEKGVEWLKRYQAEQVQKLKNAKTKTNPWKEHADNLDALVYMVLADADVADNDMLEFLYRDRTKLSVYAMALYGLALEKQKQAEKLAMMLQNIDQYLVQDDENDTAYLKVPDGNFWWFWYGSEVEANAFYLKLLARTDAKQEKASRLAKYLINNRKHATYWNSIRDTSFAIEALAEYFVASGESQPDMTVEVWYDGKKQKDVKITAENLFTFDNQFTLSGAEVTSGEHKLELRRQGKGPLYFNAYLTNFTLEDFITKAGLEIKTNRKFYKLVREEKSVKVAGSRGQAADQRVEKYRREELKEGAELKSGDLVEVELEIDSKNDYEYLMFADMKASGFEPVDLRSGYNGNDMHAYMELRDQKVTFFVHWLARGKHSVKYRLRAEIPGKFSALPAQGTAVYAPELRSNSDEMKISIVD